MNDIRALIQEHLTPRQITILEHRLAGHSWRTIGRALGISEATARGHHDAALKRLDTILQQRRQENTP